VTAGEGWGEGEMAAVLLTTGFRDRIAKGHTGCPLTRPVGHPLPPRGGEGTVWSREVGYGRTPNGDR